MAELEPGGGVGNRLDAKVDPCEGAHGLAVVDGVLQGLIGEPIPLLEKANAQHAFDAHGRPAAFALRVKGLNEPHQKEPRHHGVHLREEDVPAGELLFPGIL